MLFLGRVLCVGGLNCDSSQKVRERVNINICAKVILQVLSPPTLLKWLRHRKR